MKKLLVAAFLSLAFFGASAQQKIGHVNLNELYSSMPEAAKTMKELEDFKVELGQHYDDLTSQLNAADSTYKRDSVKYTASLKQIKIDEMKTMFERLQNWQQEAQERFQAEAAKKYGPIQEKAITAIKAVAKEGGYSYVLDTSSLIVSPPNEDLLPVVRKKLGITAPPAARPGLVKP